MGFKITVTYDSAILGSPKVTKGDITENGMMNDSIGVTPEGKFDVVWSGTQNSVGDGTLFVMSFTALKAEDTQIKLSCSQPDTFNESWEDVELKCSDIAVVFSNGNNELITEIASESESEADQTSDATASELTSSSANKPSSEEIKNAVDIVLDETDKGHIDEIPEEEKTDFVDRTNEVLGQLTGNDEKFFENAEDIREAYNGAVADEFVEDTKDAVDSDKIDSAITDSLTSVGAESIEQIPEEKKGEFVQKVENNIAQYAPDVDAVSDKLTEDEAVEAIKQLQSENAEAATQGTKLPEPQGKNNTAVVISVAVAILIAAVVVTFTVVYIKRKKNKEAK